MKPRDDQPGMPPAPDASTLPPIQEPGTAATAVAEPPKDVLPPGPKNDKEQAELEARKKQEEKNKNIQNHKEDWVRHNTRRWTNIKNAGAFAAATSNASVKAGIDDAALDYESGYYKLEGKENAHLAILHLFQDPKTGALMVNICKAPGTYEDYGNGRDLLQSQGCTQITYDYPEVYDVNPAETIKFMLDSIYKNVGNFDNRGNAKPGTNNEFKDTPAAISLGSTVHKYIEMNIGYLDSKNPFLRKRAEQCQKMLELERLSQQKQMEHAQELKAASTTPKATATKTVESEESYIIPKAPPGPDADAAKVTATKTVETEEKTTVRTPEPPLAKPVEEVRVPQQPAAVLDSDVDERSKKIIAAAEDLGNKMGEMVSNLPNGKDVFAPNEISNIQKVTALIDRLPELAQTDKEELKSALKEYVDVSRADDRRDVSRSDLVKAKFDEMIAKADVARNKDLGDRLQLVKDKFEETAPTMTHGLKKE